MALTKEQATEIKKQLLSQVENLPQENKEQIKQHIISLDENQLEEFLRQNNIQTQQGTEQGNSPDEPIFKQIVDGKIPSYKIDENDKALAILEINPLSKGHSIILPKQRTPIEKIPKSSLTLAQKIAKRIKIKLKPEDIKIETSSFQEYPMINIIPLYKDEKLEKKKAEESELKKIQSQLQTKKRAKRIKQTKPIDEKQLPEVKPRIP